MYYFKEIKATTKQAQAIKQAYNYATPCRGSGVYAIYERPSRTKEKIYWEWYGYFTHHGTIKGIRITGNSFNFTIYCLLDEETYDTTTGELIIVSNLYQITPCNNRVINYVIM